jgi:alkanesulfonate monooxygenase SsuD/methylene tetrahydromethanopterin reductase-like flavin-dependent oxidoreductase (luciferase family)
MSKAATNELVEEQRVHLPLYDETNKLKLGTFSTNVSGGMSISAVPTSYEVTWEHTLAIARKADQMGLDMVIPVGRWRGYGGETDFNGTSFETYTWAAGLAQATERVMCFATSHVPITHPVVAAKQAATIDHISGGRFGLNIVMGWFNAELGMFGATQREHDERYQVGAEWIEVIEKLWIEDEPFDYEGEFFTLKDAVASPKPIQQPHPVIMNAGSSPAGSDFAARYADVNFVAIQDIESAGEMVRSLQQHAYAEYKRKPLVFSLFYVVCRDTEQEAIDAHRQVLDYGDRPGVRNLMKMAGAGGARSFDSLFAQENFEDHWIAGYGAVPVIGTPEQVAQKFIDVYDQGIGGIGLGFIDYVEEMGYFDDKVMPLLREAGLRG